MAEVSEGATSTLDGLPVAVELGPRLRDEVASWAEQHLGWQTVPLEGPPAPVLALVDSDAAPRSPCPAVVVVDGPADAEAVRAAVATGATDAIGWPDDRDRLRSLPDPPAVGRPPEGGRTVVVGGVGGGAGASTVALAIGGLAAWSGRSALVCGDDDVLGLGGLDGWQGPGGADLVALGGAAAEEVGALARQVPGVPRLSALGRGRGVRDTAGWPADLVVVDAGPLPPSGEIIDVDVLVARPDARLARLAPLPRPVVLVGDGPVPPRAVARALGRPPVARVPWSARVAAAGVRGRVPAALPGRWLRSLTGVVRAVAPPREVVGPAARGPVPQVGGRR